MNLEETIYSVLIEEIVQKVVERLNSLPKKALVVFTGSTIGFADILETFKRLSDEGYLFHVYLTESAEVLLDRSEIEASLKPVEIICGKDRIPEELVSEHSHIIVPSMTINTAAKLANCIADTAATRLISHAMMKGKRVLISIDGCYPDNPMRQEKGYDMTPALKQQLRSNIETLRSYGAKLTTGAQLYDAVKGLAVAKKGDSKAVVLDKKVIGRTDIVTNKGSEKIKISKDALVTQMAKDAASQYNIELIRE